MTTLGDEMSRMLTAPRRAERADSPEQEGAREALDRVASRLSKGSGEENADLTWAWRRAGRVPCATCRGSGRATRGYCACPNGATERAANEAYTRLTEERRIAEEARTWDAIFNAPRHIHIGALTDIPQADVRKRARAFKRTWDWTQNLILYGPTGRGKTSVALSLATLLRDEALRTRPFPSHIRFMSMTEMQRYLKAGLDASRTGQGASYEQRMEALCKYALLICDDVGTERRTDWWPTPFYDILYARYNAGKPTWITTNLTIDVDEESGAISGSLVEWLDDDGRLISRLLERGVLLPVMTGRDLRLARRQEEDA